MRSLDSMKTEEIGGAELRVWASLGLEKVKELEKEKVEEVKMKKDERRKRAKEEEIAGAERTTGKELACLAFWGKKTKKRTREDEADARERKKERRAEEEEKDLKKALGGLGI
ncbi:hypothetical protein EG329_009162 [Mollisiaceae sp. DMI_Dod_QoI]|nr:hypothetical protein EG329_009162 [Helotiales sp. DMI_Dod_QoI]